ncbi:GNAT family N-acetyltransferase [Enterovibrio calviensis]|uniref:GNAT family N-acetyltransferase n=1 Tax=Enterovibrio calviensis TaxID=91359 RepID=UPI0004839610|nr:GNAT family N-acetyltransferase [Enterovibrio calviensis]
MEIKAVNLSDVAAVQTLIATVSEHDVLPLFNAQGREEYKTRVLPDIQTTFDESQFTTIKADHDGEVVGFAALRDGNYVTHLFVSKSCQGTGLGRKLLTSLLNSTTEKEIRLRSSVNAVQFYEHVGFETAGDEASFNGIRFVPMTLVRP